MLKGRVSFSGNLFLKKGFGIRSKTETEHLFNCFLHFFIVLFSTETDANKNGLKGLEGQSVWQ